MFVSHSKIGANHLHLHLPLVRWHGICKPLALAATCPTFAHIILPPGGLTVGAEFPRLAPFATLSYIPLYRV
jgi:hypothetical protein